MDQLRLRRKNESKICVENYHQKLCKMNKKMKRSDSELKSRSGVRCFMAGKNRLLFRLAGRRGFNNRNKMHKKAGVCMMVSSDKGK